jgi:hypothetical protein
MSEFQEGKVAATFQIGVRIEDTKEAYEKEIIGIDGAKHALIGAMKALDDYRKAIQQEGIDAKIPIKETDIGMKYVTGCLEILQKLLGETEAKRFAAVGAIDALKKIVADIKKLWDEEQAKLKKIQEFESEEPKDLKNRPIGYVPKETGVELYKIQTEQLDKLLSEKQKKVRKSR